MVKLELPIPPSLIKRLFEEMAGKSIRVQSKGCVDVYYNCERELRVDINDLAKEVRTNKRRITEIHKKIEDIVILYNSGDEELALERLQNMVRDAARNPSTMENRLLLTRIGIWI